MEYYDEILEFINNYKTETFIYPRVIQRQFNINGLEIYKVLEILVDKNILKRVYQLQCSECGFIDNVIYYSLNQIDDDVCCGNCRNEFNVIKDSVLFYKKN